MRNTTIQKSIQKILDKAGVTLNGSHPHDIKLLDERALKRILIDGSLGLGESYMEGWWDCDRLDELFYMIFSTQMYKEARTNFYQLMLLLSAKLYNPQSRRLAKQVAEKHYNLDEHLFELMLGPSMAYSCGYWKTANDLTAAQMDKFALTCKKLYLTSEDTLLDIGCGWGGLAAYAAEHFGCRVVGISISPPQISYAKQRYKHLPVEFYLADYRDTSIYNPTQKQFSKLVSIGAFEHIGRKNYQHFFQLMKQQIKANGLFLLHTIGNNESSSGCDPWINKYIFPNGEIPSMAQLTKAVEGLFVVEDLHNFGFYYDKTLLAWHQNFENNWDSLKSCFDKKFYRMWRYYLLTCAALFRSRTSQLWQIVLSKSGIKGAYESFR
jgi:cyclopropane-fatty-acyl-phospholipid synthase